VRYAKEGFPFIVGGPTLALGAVLLGYRFARRRIVTYGAGGEQVAQGERMGLGSTIRVPLGEQTSAGTSMIAEPAAA
jgi:hypothetical protein